VTAKKKQKKWEQSWDVYHEGCQECVSSSCDEGAKEREQAWDVYHEGCQECVSSSCDEGARYPVQ